MTSKEENMAQVHVVVNDRFSFRSYQYGWVLVEATPGINKEGKPTLSKSQSYWPTIKTICLAIIDRSTKVDCDSAESILKAIKTAENNILDAVRKLNK